MNDRSNRTVICSIAFVDIVDYSKRVGQEQLALKERFNSLIGEVVKDIAQNDRVLIDTGDGAALCFMGDPEDALFVAMNLRDRMHTPENEAIGLTVRIGINLGPVRLIHDINNHQNVIGDGINVAQRVMSFAEPNQIMVSRTYFEVVSRLSQEFTRLFHYAGARTDKHVREHEVYEVGPGKDDVARVAVEQPLQVDRIGVTPPPEATATDATVSAATVSAATAPVPSRNKWLVVGAVAALIVLAIGIFAGTQFKSEKAGVAERVEAAAVPPPEPAAPQVVGSAPGAKTVAEPTVPAAPKVVGSTPGAKPVAEATVPAAQVKAPRPEPAKPQPPLVAEKAVNTEAPATKKNAARKDNVAKAENTASGTLEFSISPWGDVFIDGKQVGTSPPLKAHKLPAGAHKVEVYNDNAGFPYTATVEVKADEVLRIHKSFPAAR